MWNKKYLLAAKRAQMVGVRWGKYRTCMCTLLYVAMWRHERDIRRNVATFFQNTYVPALLFGRFDRTGVVHTNNVSDLHQRRNHKGDTPDVCLCFFWAVVHASRTNYFNNWNIFGKMVFPVKQLRCAGIGVGCSFP